MGLLRRQGLDEVGGIGAGREREGVAGIWQERCLLVDLAADSKDGEIDCYLCLEAVFVNLKVFVLANMNACLLDSSISRMT